MERIQGSLWLPIKVIAIVDVSGSLIPFFVTKQKAIELKKLIDEAILDSDTASL